MYFEAHVTIEPVFEERFELFKTVCNQFGFRAAELLMKKRKHDTPQRSTYDSFCTSRSDDVQEISTRMKEFMHELTKIGFQVWRFKVEQAIIDSRYDDSMFPLKSSKKQNASSVTQDQ